MFYPKTSYAKIAFDAILFFISTGQIKKSKEDQIPADLKLKVACVVSIFDVDDNLISCYGNIEPNNKMLYDEIIENAIKAASDNTVSIKSEQLSELKVYVDILSSLHKVEDINDIKPQKHGLFIKEKSGKSGFIMPNRKGIKTFEKQLKQLQLENEIKETNMEKLELWYFKSTRYD